MTDETLIEQMKAGDDGAFRSIYGRYRDPLFRFGYRLTGSEETAEDMVHDAFLGLFRGGFDARRAALKTYLYGAMRNQARKRFRHSGREEAGDTDYSDERAGPLEVLLSAETGEQVRRAVSGLPLAQREALILFEYEELSLEEIAQIVEAEVGAVKARLYRARDGLRKSLVGREVAK
jgi:RNA polymerase sigma-70 factor (ECF subfamily)